MFSAIITIVVGLVVIAVRSEVGGRPKRGRRQDNFLPQVLLYLGILIIIIGCIKLVNAFF